MSSMSTTSGTPDRPHTLTFNSCEGTKTRAWPFACVAHAACARACVRNLETGTTPRQEVVDATANPPPPGYPSSRPSRSTRPSPPAAGASTTAAVLNKRLAQRRGHALLLLLLLLKNSRCPRCPRPPTAPARGISGKDGSIQCWVGTRVPSAQSRQSSG